MSSLASRLSLSGTGSGSRESAEVLEQRSSLLGDVARSASVSPAKLPPT